MRAESKDENAWAELHNFNYSGCRASFLFHLALFKVKFSYEQAFRQLKKSVSAQGASST